MHGNASAISGQSSNFDDRSDPAANFPPLDFAAEFAAFAAALTVNRLPPEALAAARLNLLDTLACATAGRTAPGVAEVLRPGP